MPTTKQLPAGDPREFGFDAARLERIGRTMDAAVDARKIPGTVTLVARKGRVVHTHVTGKLDIDRPPPLAIDSLFRMYSQTKPMTAAVLLTLYEDGLFMLDEPVSKWIPEFKNPKVVAHPQAKDRVRGTPAVAATNVTAARRGITRFDLWPMTSGVPSMSRTPVAYWPTFSPAWEGTGFGPGDTRFNDPKASYDELVLALANNPLHSHPGETWQ